MSNPYCKILDDYRELILIIYSGKNINNPILLFDNGSLNFVNHHKHLGVTFSHDTKWHEHINSLLSSAAKSLAMLRKIVQLLIQSYRKMTVFG